MPPGVLRSWVATHLAKEKRGGDQKVRKVSDEDLRGLLSAHASSSCNIHAKLKQPILRLGSSVSKLHLKDARLREAGSYRTVLKRLRGCRVGVARGKRATDVCDICKSWDYNILPKIVHDLDDCEAALGALDAGYFEGFLRERRLDDPSYYLDWCAWVEKRRGERGPGDGELDAAEHMALEKFGDSLAGWQQHVKEWPFHFSFRDALRKRFERDRSTPQPGTIYLLWDHEDCPREYFAPSLVAGFM